MKKNKNITACILSGGKSSRMGTNKALLDIGGKSLIERTIELLDMIFSEVVISSNKPSKYDNFGKEIITDNYPHRGPLSGIQSVLSDSKTERNFIISCDMPIISKELIKYLVDYKTDTKILLPQADGRIQQLCGIYSKSILPVVENLLIESQKPNSKLKGSIFDLLDKVKVELVDVDKLDFYHSNLFLNINTVEDYNLAKSILEQK